MISFAGDKESAMNLIVLAVCVSLCACGTFHERAAMPRPPVCVQGGNRPVQISMDDYGSTYTPDMQRGPAPAAPDSYLVPEAMAGKECDAPPWWDAPER